LVEIPHKDTSKNLTAARQSILRVRPLTIQ
jgi:hypothetical protein